MDFVGTKQRITRLIAGLLCCIVSGTAISCSQTGKKQGETTSTEESTVESRTELSTEEAKETEETKETTGTEEGTEESRTELPTEEPKETTGAEESTDEPQTESPAEDSEYLVLLENGESRYHLVQADNMEDMGTTGFLALNHAIYEKTGKKLKVRSDILKPGEKLPDNEAEILIGKTNRPLSKTLLSSLREYQFAICSNEKQLAIVGYSDQCLYEGIVYFLEHYMTDEYIEYSGGNMKIRKNIFYQSDGSTHAFEKLLRSGTELNSDCKELFVIPRPNDDAKSLQGGFTDGTYYYQTFIKRDKASNEENNLVYIVKYDIAAKKTVKVSEPLPLNHANDITLNTAKNQLIVAHNNPNRTKISILDPDTLTIIETIDIGYKIYSIDYNETRNRYVIGVSGGQTFRILDDEFRPVAGPFNPTSLTTGYITQGCTCDDNFIYFVLYKENVITVYDWSGKFVTLIRLNVGTIEPENLSVVNDVIYVGCSKGGGKVFQVTFPEQLG